MVKKKHHKEWRKLSKTAEYSWIKVGKVNISCARCKDHWDPMYGLVKNGNTDPIAWICQPCWIEWPEGETRPCASKALS